MTSETTRPSEHYTQHHDVEPPRVDATAFRQGWRIRTRLDALLADGRISAATWQAATEYRDSWNNAFRLTASPITAPTRVSGGMADYHQIKINCLDATKRIREAHRAIGDLAASLVAECILDNASWASIARQLSINPETARDRTATALTALAEAWNAQSPR